jgi:hypothetical protein
VPLTVCEHHRAHRRDDQQGADHLEGEDVAREDEVGQADDVAVLVRLGEALVGHDRVAQAEDQQAAEAERGHDGGDPLTAQGLDQRVGRVHADEHQDEQEQHHHGAGVDDDLDDAEERSVLGQVEHGQREHGQGEQERRVHRLLGGEHAERGEHRHGGQDPERDCLAGPGVGGGCEQLRGGGHSGSPCRACRSAAYFSCAGVAALTLPR